MTINPGMLRCFKCGRQVAAKPIWLADIVLILLYKIILAKHHYSCFKNDR